MIRIDGARLLADLRQLATFGRCGTGVDRVAFSAADIAARRWLAQRMCEAGLDARMDRAANVYGFDPRAARAVLIGSHSDTVPKGGWLDGALGVIYALEIARAAIESGERSPLGVDVVSFEDEEGTHLSLMGSRTFCGELPDANLERLAGRDAALAAALAALREEALPSRIDPARHVCYLEAHIEQGPRLEAAGRRIGIVTAIVGIRRIRIRAKGQADHAGTTPMAMRKDAGMALFRLAARVAETFPRLAGPETVWNIGQMAMQPGAANVVPGEAWMLLEFRDTDPAILDRLERAVLGWIAEPNQEHAELSAETIARVPPSATDRELAETIAAAARERGQEPLWLPSGAGHDAMILEHHLPVAMLFVPSIGGRSHDITENTADADIVLGCEVLAAAADRIRERAAK
jgi:N-carbamoyl-L-amino-acid hydrolase